MPVKTCSKELDKRMTRTLPEPYVQRMKQQLGADFASFLDSYEQPRTYGLRLNTSKLHEHPERLDALREQFHLTPIPWCDNGYYYDEHTRPGLHPYHAAGLYYIQEPSAMTAVELLAPQPGSIVLDLAAAPGGKSTQIADHLQGQGCLIANEIHPSRARILSENIERLGIANAIVTNETPARLATRFPAFFDHIMLDAPCSGEGMFRKEPETITQWSEQQVAVCAQRQLDILQEAVKMLKPGGTLGYSTCTFNLEENEHVVAQFVEQFPEMSVQRMERFWPHKQRGEGHFVAILRKQDSGGHLHAAPSRSLHTQMDGHLQGRGALTAKPNRRQAINRTAGKKSRHNADNRMHAARRWFEAFAEQYLCGFELSGELILFGEQLYMLPSSAHAITSDMLQGIKTLRPGLHLGSVRKDRFEPSHALALYLQPHHVKHVHNLSADSDELAAYLRGETLLCEHHNGWTLVTVDGYSLGWGKASHHILKNHYPKGLRRAY